MAGQAWGLLPGLGMEEALAQRSKVAVLRGNHARHGSDRLEEDQAEGHTLGGRVGGLYPVTLLKVQYATCTG